MVSATENRASPAGGESSARRRRLAAFGAVLIAAPLLLPLYTMNPLIGFAAETFSATITAHSIAREGDFALNEYFDGRPPLISSMDYAFPEVDGVIRSVEAPASALTFAPFLLPYRNVDLWPHRQFVYIGSRTGALVAILALILLAGWLLSQTSIPRALLVTAVVALATNHWTTLAGGTWSHTSGVLWLVTGLLLWSRASRRQMLYPLAGVALVIAAACRPILAPTFLLLLYDATVRCSERRVVISTAAAIGLTGGIVLAGNLALYGSVFGGRAAIIRNIVATHGVESYFGFSPMHWIGLLASPSRGLFIYSPVLLFALPGLVRTLGRGGDALHRRISIAGLLCFGSYSVIETWWGGFVFGPRYMTDLLPFFAFWLALTPLPARGLPVWGALFAVALGWSVWVQHLGTTRYPCGWNDSPASVDHAHARLWDWRDTQLRRCLELPPPQAAGS